MKHTNALRLTAILLALSLLVGFAVCGQPSAAAESNHVPVIRVGTIQKQNHFSATQSGSAYGRMNYNNFTQANLLNRDEHGNIQPGFFQSWEVSEDALSMTVTFPTNAFWHDGEPVTFEDVEYTLLSMNANSKYQVESVEELGEGQAKITYSTPISVSYLNGLTITAPLLAKHIWDGKDVETYFEPDAAVGCGPFRFVSCDVDAQISYYEAVDNYYGEEITVDRVEVHTYGSQDAIVMALMSNEIDCVFDYSNPVDVSLAELLLTDENIDLGAGANIGTYYMSFGCQNAPFDEAAFREALIYALDYEVMAEVVNGQYGLIPNIGIVPPTNLGHDASLPQMKQDLELSNSLLDELGYKDVDGDGYREFPDGSAMDLMVTTYNVIRPEMYQRLYEVAAQEWAKVGIRVHIDAEAQASSDVLRSRVQTGVYEIYFGIATSGAAPIQTAFLYMLESSRLAAGTCPGEEINSYYQKALNAPTTEKYIEYIQKVQALNGEVFAGTALCWDQAFFPYRTDAIEGWTNFPAWGVINYRTWFTATAK